MSKKCFEVTFPGRQTESVTERHETGTVRKKIICFCICFRALSHMIDILHMILLDFGAMEMRCVCVCVCVVCVCV